jgi:hypothetical protein
MAKFNSAWLLRKRQFRALTGVEADVFRQMVERLRPSWKHQIIEPKNRDGRPWGVGGLEEHLLVLLIVYRCCVTQDFIGCLYQVDKSAICRALQRLEPLAAAVLGVKRKIEVSREEAEALIIDCTEQLIQRPLRHQRRWYSGKKKRHTIKTEIIVTEQGRFVSTSKPAPDRVSDITIRRRGPKLPKGCRAHADSGYQGLQLDHPDVDIPYKKSKKKPLTKDERVYNGALSRFRVRVEHSIAKLKSFRMLSERYRYPKATYAAKFSIIAGTLNIAAGF